MVYFRRSKTLIPVADGSTGLLVVTTPCFCIWVGEKKEKWSPRKKRPGNETIPGVWLHIREGGLGLSEPSKVGSAIRKINFYKLIPLPLWDVHYSIPLLDPP